MSIDFGKIEEFISIPFAIIKKSGHILYVSGRAEEYFCENKSIYVLGGRLVYNGRCLVNFIQNNTDNNFTIFLQKHEKICGIVSIRRKEFKNDEIYIVYIFDNSDSELLMCNEKMSIDGLSKSETEIVFMISSGLTPDEVARKRKTSINTIRCQIKSIQNKTGIRNISQISSYFSVVQYFG